MTNITTDVAKVPEGAFYECSALRGVYTTDAKSIGADAFSGCESLRYFRFSENLKSVADGAFDGVVFKGADGSVMEPTADNLRGHKFTGEASVLELYIPPVGGTLPVDGIMYKILTSEVGDMTLGVRGFVDGYSSETLELPDTIRYLGFDYSVVTVLEKAFMDDKTLKSADLGSVTYVGFKAFAQCKALESVTMDSAEKIGSYAFFQFV